ncbi:4Fe-4S binding protein [Halodesulfovibrio marinisediminis]|uniref:4Fe-4S dicluster domain-containing protein n=1 Tax=Halodesulfovibrio marinisediminis DSM 17456 TaxID=1121457 RepID=A0A1N6FLA8_9BACT|nr:4Fe-4S binding protein [Halodesulfovibrio marinisediminis]SIN96073.1 4Fe-4S dicluster domain-containing protein [Halodesulfovibrio marinisediminis DSM 17456]
MNIAEIYNMFDQIGCLTFATIENGIPQTRIAHLFAYDAEGLYFRTMITKPFYKQLTDSKKVSICGMFPSTSISHDDQGMPYFPPGYTIRVTGDVIEVPFDTLRKKAENNELFQLGVKDIEKYPAMVTFCLHKAWGEIFDFDFEMEKRSHKLLRTSFSIGGLQNPAPTVRITEKCISCGKCFKRCSFKAIIKHEDTYRIDPKRCDVCGDCYMACPVKAIEYLNTDLINTQKSDGCDDCCMFCSTKRNESL